MKHVLRLLSPEWRTSIVKAAVIFVISWTLNQKYSPLNVPLCPQPQSIVDRAHQPGDGGSMADGGVSPQKVLLQPVPEESSTDPDEGDSVSKEQFTFTPAAGKEFKNVLNSKP